MKALVYDGPNTLDLREVPDVSPKAGEVKLKIRACGICGSDVHGYLGLTGRRIAPMVMGHEFAGEIVELGSQVEGLQVGARVAAYPVDFCGECPMCKAGDVHLCLNKRAYGVLDVDGAFAQYLCVPAKCCFPLADSISWAEGSLMEPLAVSYRGVNRAGDLAGKTVVVVGAGTIGLLALACVKLKGAKKILMSDLSDHRLEVARSMGADITVNPQQEDFREVVLSHTDGQGADVSIEAVGVTPTVQQAMSALRFGGTAVWIGNNRPTVEVHMQELVTRELKVFGSFLYGFEEFRTVVELLNQGKLHVKPLISREIPLEEAPALFHTLAHDPGDLIKVVVRED